MLVVPRRRGFGVSGEPELDLMPSVIPVWGRSYASRVRAAKNRPRKRGGSILGVRSRNAQPFPTDFAERPRKRSKASTRMSARSGRTRTTTKRRRRPKMGATVGNPRRYDSKKSRLTRRGMQTSLLFSRAIVRLQGVKKELQAPDFATGTVLPGWYNINTGLPATTISDNSVRPVYVVDLEVVNNAGIVNPVVVQMSVGDNASIGWESRTSQNNVGGTVTSQWWPEDLRYISGDSTPNAQYLQQMWYDIRLKLYGARRQAVTYDVFLCRFREAHMIPLALREATTLSAGDQAEYFSFWQNFARNLSYNTILPGAGKWRRGLQVLRHKRAIMSASTSDDLDTQPDNVDLKWFVRDGNVKSFVDNNNYFTDQATLETGAWNQYTAATNCLNRPSYEKGRMFLVIRATDISATQSGVDEDADDNPSFDMCIRKKVVVYPTNT